MSFRPQRPGADVFAPRGDAADEALSRVTHLGIGAHADDVEIMAWHGVHAGRTEEGAAFGAVVCTDGRRAPRAGAFAGVSDARLREVRREEQREAARRGDYAVAVQLDHPSESLQRGVEPAVVDDLAAVLDAARPHTVYTHAPTDAHRTHVGVCVAVLRAVRRLPEASRPRTLLGCEVWGGLDWLPEADKRRLPLPPDADPWRALIRSFASQIDGGRPYDAGAVGRARANAVFHDAREAAAARAAHQWQAFDLGPLVQDGDASLADFVRERIARFEADALDAIAACEGTREGGSARSGPPAPRARTSR